MFYLFETDKFFLLNPVTRVRLKLLAGELSNVTTTDYVFVYIKDKGYQIIPFDHGVKNAS